MRLYKLCSGARQQQQWTAERAGMWSPYYVDRLLPQLSNWLPGPTSLPRGWLHLTLEQCDCLFVTALGGGNGGGYSFVLYYLPTPCVAVLGVVLGFWRPC